MLNGELKYLVFLLAFYLIIDECWVVFEGGSPVLVGVRIPDSHQATAAVHDSPLH